MTNKEQLMTRATGTNEEYIRDLDMAGQYWIIAQKRKGADFILLSDLYDTFQAETKAEKTSLRTSLRVLCHNGVIRIAPGYKGAGLYEVLR